MSNNAMSSATAMLAALAMSGAGMPGMEGIKFPKEKKEPTPRKCILPGCEKQTIHRGGYCCAEHSRQHKLLQRSNAK